VITDHDRPRQRGAGGVRSRPHLHDARVQGERRHPDGNLVLVGAADLSFGLRAEPDGSLYYENLPVIDHNHASLGQPGAVEPPGDPLGLLNQFAEQVKLPASLR